MQKIETKIRTTDPGYRDNRQRMEGLVGDLRERLRRARAGGDEESRRRHVERGKLLARERVEALIDPQTPFLELSPLAANDLYDGEAPAAGIITGIGPIHGRQAMMVANDATVKGGTYFPHDREEAPARAGDRPREPSALRLPRRLRRRLPAAAGRDLPRPRSLRAHLLQPGAPFGGGASRRSPW